MLTAVAATAHIRRLSADADLDLVLTRHALDRMQERGLLIDDIRYVLRMGYVFTPPDAASTAMGVKCLMESSTPNSGKRKVRVVLVLDVDLSQKTIIVKTVMWVDKG